MPQLRGSNGKRRERGGEGAVGLAELIFLQEGGRERGGDTEPDL